MLEGNQLFIAIMNAFNGDAKVTMLLYIPPLSPSLRLYYICIHMHMAGYNPAFPFYSVLLKKTIVCQLYCPLSVTLLSYWMMWERFTTYIL